MKRYVISSLLLAFSTIIPFLISGFLNTVVFEHYKSATLGIVDVFGVVLLPLLWVALLVVVLINLTKPEEDSQISQARKMNALGLVLAIILMAVFIALDPFRLPSLFYYVSCYGLTIGIFVIGMRTPPKTADGQRKDA